MTPEQKIKHAIIAASDRMESLAPKSITVENVDEAYDAIVELDLHWDPMEDIRQGEVETDIPCEDSRHLESKSVAALMPDGTWVGWTYWYGGGKQAEPRAVDWMDSAYNLNCIETEKTVTVREFSAIK